MQAFNRSRNNYALIIGIGQYQQQWPSLKSPPSDALALSKILVENYDFKKSNITLLTDKQGDKPTLVNILTAIDTLSRKLTEKDNLLIFYSGHSTEDDEGETYWIPSDGKKGIKPSWLKHSDLAEQYFASEKMKLNNLIILTDSFFTTKILRSRPTALSPFDLRYEEKVEEISQLRSREVIAFGDAHWPGDDNTGGMGLFAYYLTKALKDNSLDITDFENLIFEENILFPIIRVAGVKLLRGRLRSAQDQEGQFAIARSVPAAVVDIATASIFPEKGYPGAIFSITATTSGPAAEVFVTLDGKRLALKGSGTQWAIDAPVERLGMATYTVSAQNINGVEGKTAGGKFQVVEKRGEVANIAALTVSPEGGFAGDPYTFTATTDRPAQNVFIVIGNDRFPMKGSGTAWRLEKTIDNIGKLHYAAIPTNIDGIPGKALEKDLALKLGPTNVVSVDTRPKSGFAGEEFVISVTTDRVAERVRLEMDGQRYDMAGSGRTWSFKKKIPDIGEKSFSVAALNPEGIVSEQKTGSIITKKSPLPIPDITQVDIRVVSPGKGYPGDQFAITAKTSAPSDKVWIEIDDKRLAMTGSQTDWQYTTSIARLGRTPVVLSAINKDAVRGQTWEGAILTVKKPAALVQIASASASPTTGIRGRPFEFAVKTDRQAESVILTVGENRYPMQGSGTEWRLSRAFDQTGDLAAVIAAGNEDGVYGSKKDLSITVMAQRYEENTDGTLTDLMTGKKQQRFKDNDDGTVTDYLTNLMWTKSPKQIAVDWDAANDYCRDLTVEKLTGWRLPTIREFTQLVDAKQQNPALPPGNPFSNIITHVGYWTKSRHKFGPKYVYQMSLWYGKANHLSKDADAVVWPVRYADVSN
ncbi:MAG: DUF1566 domain-containing protein [Pseudomonadota bacterium]